MIKQYLVLALFLVSLSVGLKADPLPVKVTFRQSLLFPNSFVAQIRNEGDKNLVVHAEFDRADQSARKSYTLLVPADHFKEVGHHEGWSVKSGDQITLTSQGYDDLHCGVP